MNLRYKLARATALPVRAEPMNPGTGVQELERALLDQQTSTIASSPTHSAAAAPLPPKGSPPSFLARMAQGEIELLAVCSHPSTNQPWWRPDGTPWANAGFENITRHESVTKGRRFEFAFQRRGLPKDTSLEYSFEPGALELSWADQPRRQGKSLPDHNLAVALLPESATEVNLTLGVAAGDWKAMMTRTPQAGASGSFQLGAQTCRALFLDPVESSGEARVAVSYNKVPGWTVRVTAVDTSGKLHESFPHMASHDNVAVAEGRFTGLRLDEVKEFRFEARPYTYVEFRNLSLEPGKRTQVEVVETKGD